MGVGVGVAVGVPIKQRRTITAAAFCLCSCTQANAWRTVPQDAPRPLDVLFLGHVKKAEPAAK